MNHETARTLLQVIADIQGMTFDAQIKITALERALKEYEPNLFARYEKELESLRKHPPFSVNPEGYAGLLERLSQDR